MLLFASKLNYKLQVMHSGGDFILIVKQVDPGMAGSVTCELRRSLPNRKSLLINSATTYLSIVPPDLLYKEIILSRPSFKRYVFDNASSKTQVAIKNDSELNGIHKNVSYIFYVLRFLLYP